MPQKKPASLKETATLLRSGGIIAYPTESVFGLGCLPSLPQSIQQLLKVKERSANKGLIIVGAELRHFDGWIEPLSNIDEFTINATHDRPTTWLVQAKKSTTPLLTGDSPLLAIRISQHPYIQSLCRELGEGIISTSANLSGETPARQASQINDILASRLDLIVDEPCGKQTNPSRICDLSTGRVLRE